MALKAKTKPSAYARKRQAQHHRRSKHYIKAYYPYLPMLAIAGGGYLLDKIWTPAKVNAASINDVAYPSRLSVITSDHSFVLLYIILGITFLAFALFIMLHWYRVQRVLNRGEAFMVHHTWFDICLVLIFTAGVVLTRS
jgi:uncharacterized membrane protein YidH (DUF202 family)